jgi:hypothetical protein
VLLRQVRANAVLSSWRMPSLGVRGAELHRGGKQTGPTIASDDCVTPLPNPPPEAALLTASCPGCCESTGLFLEFTSAAHDANHFQCTACGHVWEEPKTESGPLE